MRKKVGEKMSEPWERVEGETPKAYAAFCVYRDLGKIRSLQKAGRKQGESRAKKAICQWSAKYNWVARANAYDDYIEKKKREQNEQEILQMNETHAKVAMLMIMKVLAKVKSVDPETLTPMDAAKWIDVASKLERVSRGEPSDKIDMDAKIKRFIVKVPEELEGE